MSNENGPTVKRVPITARYPEDRIKLLDAVSKRRGDKDRAATIAALCDAAIEAEFPGATITTQPERTQP